MGTWINKIKTVRDTKELPNAVLRSYPPVRDLINRFAVGSDGEWKLDLPVSLRSTARISVLLYSSDGFPAR